MSFKTFSGKMSPDEIEKLMEVITLYSTGKVMKAKSGLPNTHKSDNLQAKNDNWKNYIMEEE